MTNPDPELYKAFEEILKRAPHTATYECELERTDVVTGRPVRTFHKYEGHQFRKLPWGQLGAIYRVEWKPDDAAPSRGKADFVSISFTHDGGIAIQNCFLEFGSHAVGLKGHLPGNRPGIDLQDPLTMRRHVVDSIDELVEVVLGLIDGRDYPFDE